MDISSPSKQRISTKGVDIAGDSKCNRPVIRKEYYPPKKKVKKKNRYSSFFVLKHVMIRAKETPSGSGTNTKDYEGSRSKSELVKQGWDNTEIK